MINGLSKEYRRLGIMPKYYLYNHRERISTSLTPIYSNSLDYFRCFDHSCFRSKPQVETDRLFGCKGWQYERVSIQVYKFSTKIREF